MAYHSETEMKIVTCLRKDPCERNKEDLDNLCNYLHQLECCRHLREPALRQLCTTARYEWHPANTIVYSCGDVISCWYILLTGSVIIDQFLFTARRAFGERQTGCVTRANKCITVDESEMIVFDYEGCGPVCRNEEASSQHLLFNSRLSRHLSDTSLTSFTIADDLIPSALSRHNGQLKSTFATSSDTSSVCSNWSAVQPSSDGLEDEQMIHRHDSGRGFELDFSGLEESTVDSDDEDTCSVNTEAPTIPDAVIECLEKDPCDRTEDDIENLLNAVQHLQAFCNLTMTTRRALCAAMVYAVVEKADTIVMNDGEELDSWCVIFNGQVDIVRRNGTIEHLQLGDSFGITPTMETMHHDGIMHTKVDNCQFLCIPQAEYYRILHQGEENTMRLSENGELVLVTEQLVSDGQNKRQRIILRGTAAKLIDQLKYDVDGIDMYVEDFLLTHRTFVKNSRDITQRLEEWFTDSRTRDKVVSIVLEWINNHFGDFETDPSLNEFLERLEESLEKQQLKSQLRLLNIARTAKARTRTIVLTRATRDEVLHFSVLGGVERGYGLFITKVEKGSKAETAGLKRGDQILDVNNQSFEKISHVKALEILRGTTHLSITVKSNVLAFREMLETPNGRPSAGSKKHSKHSSGDGAGRPGIQPAAPVIMSVPASAANGGKSSSSLSTGQKASKIRNALSRLNLLRPLYTSNDSNLSRNKFPGSTLSVGGSPLVKNRLSASHPDLSSLQLLGQSDINRRDFPEHCLKVFRSDHTCRYLPVHKETSAHEVVMLALQAFNDTEASSKFSLYEVTVQFGLVKQRRLPDQLNNLADRCSFNSRYYIKHESQTDALLSDDMIDDIIRESQLHFLQLSCVEVATQLTLRNFQFFRDIEPAEYVIDLFKLSAPELRDKTSHLNTFSGLTNDEMFWVVTEVCSEPNVARRVKIIKHFIQIAKHCQEYKNYNSMFAILSGLGHGSVSRLKQTWDRLPNKYTKLFEDLQDLMDPSRNMAKYRNLVSSVRPPLIPFFPLVMKDLTFIHLGNDSTVEGLVNFEKLRMIAKEVRNICSMAPVCCDVSISVSGAALLRRQTSGQSVLNNRKMFDESQMVRRVRAYLADIKSRVVSDETRLIEMSAHCEAQQSASQLQIPAVAGRRRDVNVNINVNVGSSQSSQTLQPSSVSLAPKFGAASPDAVRKLMALSDGVRPSEYNKKCHRPNSTTHFYAPSPPRTPVLLSHSPSSVRSLPIGPLHMPGSDGSSSSVPLSIHETSSRPFTNFPPSVARKLSDSAFNSQSSRRSNSFNSTGSLRSARPVAPTRRSRPPSSSQELQKSEKSDRGDDEYEVSAV